MKTILSILLLLNLGTALAKGPKEFREYFPYVPETTSRGPHCDLTVPTKFLFWKSFAKAQTYSAVEKGWKKCLDAKIYQCDKEPMYYMVTGKRYTNLSVDETLLVARNISDKCLSFINSEDFTGDYDKERDKLQRFNAVYGVN